MRHVHSRGIVSFLFAWMGCVGLDLVKSLMSNLFWHSLAQVTSGIDNCSRRALDEEMVLQENPDTYRLSCVTTVYGDVTVKVQGAVGAAQWTR